MLHVGPLTTCLGLAVLRRPLSSPGNTARTFEDYWWMEEFRARPFVHVCAPSSFLCLQPKIVWEKVRVPTLLSLKWINKLTWHGARFAFVVYVVCKNVVVILPPFHPPITTECCDAQEFLSSADPVLVEWPRIKGKHTFYFLVSVFELLFHLPSQWHYEFI